MPVKKSSAGKKNLVQQSDGTGNLRIDKSVQPRYILQLYVCGMSPSSTLAIRNIRQICLDYLPDRCDLEVIDITKSPSRAREAQIVAAPTLIKQYPSPVHRLVGNLSQTAKVLRGLGLTPAS